jgi:hypothetical protein
VSILLLQLILLVNLTAAFHRKPIMERKKSVLDTRQRNLNGGEIRHYSRDKPLSSSPDFLGKEAKY